MQDRETGKEIGWMIFDQENWTMIILLTSGWRSRHSPIEDPKNSLEIPSIMIELKIKTVEAELITASQTPQMKAKIFLQAPLSGSSV